MSWQTNHPELAHLPEKESKDDLWIMVSGEDVVLARPKDGENCAIALGCKRQLASPLVCIERSVSYVALPGSRKQRSGIQEGEEVEGFPGKWVVYRFINGPEARRAIIGVDKQNISPTGVMVDLLHTAGTSGEKKKKAKYAKDLVARRKKGIPADRRRGRPKGKADELTLAGVRNYQGK